MCVFPKVFVPEIQQKNLNLVLNLVGFFSTCLPSKKKGSLRLGSFCNSFDAKKKTTPQTVVKNRNLAWDRIRNKITCPKNPDPSYGNTRPSKRDTLKKGLKTGVNLTPQTRHLKDSLGEKNLNPSLAG